MTVRPVLMPFHPRLEVWDILAAIEGRADVWRRSDLAAGEPEWWITYGAACDAYHRLRDHLLSRRGYVRVAEPVREGDDFRIAVTATERAHRAFAAVSAGFCWSMTDHAVSIEETDAFYATEVALLSHPTFAIYDRMEATTAPELAIYRARILERRIERWFEIIDEITDAYDPRLRQAMTLNDEKYRYVKAAAFWQKIKVWGVQSPSAQTQSIIYEADA